tara:strand:+ start:1098 stop:1691 length:594 start_codon:yes stop_codon:yes gene_type:complete
MADMYDQLELGLKLAPTKKCLHKLYHYENGKLYHRPRRVRKPRDNNWNARNANKEAGTTFRNRRDGPRVRLNVRGRLTFRSRIIWEMFYGPTNLQIDHINGDTLDDRIANLRTSTQGQNTYNRKLCTRNKTGVKGLGVKKVDRRNGTSYRKWFGKVRLNYKEKYTPEFPYTEEGKQECIIKLRELREKLHGEFAHHG